MTVCVGWGSWEGLAQMVVVGGGSSRGSCVLGHEEWCSFPPDHWPWPSRDRSSRRAAWGSLGPRWPPRTQAALSESTGQSDSRASERDLKTGSSWPPAWGHGLVCVLRLGRCQGWESFSVPGPCVSGSP